MSIKKQYLKTKPVCKVTFRIRKEANGGARKIHVVGEFNKWNKDATPMTGYKNGSFSATIDLDLNREYQFRYLVDSVDWRNDGEADTYIHSPYGNCDNSVVIT
ncbi:MAG: isoamylase early set domain-containing protein [Desulfobacula sp.]|nr:isoamylase early set domain-containing protein [Desulfobacula sp.]